MRLSRRLYNGIVLDRIPVPLDTLKEDLVRPRDLKWYRDYNDGVVDFRMKTNEHLYHVRWSGAWNIEARKTLKKLMLRWHYDRMGRLETKPWTRLPFPAEYLSPIHVDAA